MIALQSCPGNKCQIVHIVHNVWKNKKIKF